MTGLEDVPGTPVRDAITMLALFARIEEQHFITSDDWNAAVAEAFEEPEPSPRGPSGPIAPGLYLVRAGLQVAGVLTISEWNECHTRAET